MKHSRTNLFFMELVIIIVFFAFAGAVCMKIFIGAHMTSRASADLTQAVLVAQNKAERFREGQEVEKLTYYDEDWNECANDGAKRCEIQVAGGNGLSTANICVYNDRGLIFELQVGRYDE